MKKKPCRHHKLWIIASGHLCWCYECGAIREMKPGNDNTTSPRGPWIKPTGQGGKNPYESLCKK